jgi:hypothetical protein
MTVVEDAWSNLKDILTTELSLLNPKNVNLVPDISIGLNIFVNNKKLRTNIFDQSGNRNWFSESQKETKETDQHKIQIAIML